MSDYLLRGAYSHSVVQNVDWRFYDQIKYDTSVEDPVTRHSFASYLAGTNNGTLRPPNSPCFHIKCAEIRGPRDFPIERTESKYSNGYYFSYPNGLSTSSTLDVVNAFRNGDPCLYADTSLALLRQELEKQFNDVTKEWSSLNFIADIGDITSLVKRISKYRYTDYAFGIAPTVQDANALIYNLAGARTRLNTAKAVQNLSKKVRRRVKCLPTSTCDQILRTFGFKGRFTGWISGYYKLVWPELDPFIEDLYLFLDTFGFHPDLSAVWDAVPMSWLVDWFLPTSDFFSQISDRGWLKPQLILGPIGVHLKAVGDVNWSRSVHTLPGDYQVFDGRLTIYRRTGLSTATFRSSPVQLEAPRASAHRLAILSDVFGAGHADKALAKVRQRLRLPRRPVKRGSIF